MSVVRSILVVAAIGISAASPSIAAGDGGGSGGGAGGGTTPSASLPQYDTATEYRKGVEAIKTNDFAAAKRAFDHVLLNVPRDANSNYLAGVARTGLNDSKGAAKFLEKALKYNPKLIDAYGQLGTAYAKLGQRDKAQAQLDILAAKATACAKTCPEAAQIDQGTAAINAALAGTPQSRVDPAPGVHLGSVAGGDATYLAAVSLINQHRYPAALAALDEARQVFGPHPDILTYIGFVNRKLKHYDIAETYYRQALALSPGHRGATEYYGELMVERGNLVGARRMLASLDARCSYGCAEAEELRGWIADGHGKAS